MKNLAHEKSRTYLHPATGIFSSLDLSICHPSLLLDFDWTVSEDEHGSDHFHVIIDSVNNSSNNHNAEWKLSKVNWDCIVSFEIFEQNFLTNSILWYFCFCFVFAVFWLATSTDSLRAFCTSVIYCFTERPKESFGSKAQSRGVRIVLPNIR